MNEIMTREEFLKERNAVCESDAVAAGAECITLGHRILRTETAGLAVMSIIMFSADRDN